MNFRPSPTCHWIRRLLKDCLGVSAPAMMTAASVFAATPAAVYQDTGIKLCKVDANSAIVWTRLTRNAVPVSVNGSSPAVIYAGKKRGQAAENRPDTKPVVRFPTGVTVDMLQSAVPGASGQTRVLYRVRGQSDRENTTWHDVDPNGDSPAGSVGGKVLNEDVIRAK